MKNTVFLAALVLGTLTAGVAFAGDKDKDKDAPLPIAALGLPIAGALMAYAVRRRKA